MIGDERPKRCSPTSRLFKLVCLKSSRRQLEAISAFYASSQVFGQDGGLFHLYLEYEVGRGGGLMRFRPLFLFWTSYRRCMQLRLRLLGVRGCSFQTGNPKTQEDASRRL